MGRLMAGAHYLSDVTIGAVIALGLLTIFYCQVRYSSKYLNE
jgi:membrane-associated phospholipid phosphatase